MPNLVNIVIPPLPQAYTYAVPEEIEQDVEIGSRVVVPLGKRHAHGYVVSKFPLTEEREQSLADIKLKPVSTDGKGRPCFSVSQLRFFEWIAKYYGDSLANVIDVAIPPIAPRKFQRLVQLIGLSSSASLRGALQRKIVERLQHEKQPLPMEALTREFRGAPAAVRALAAAQIVLVTEAELVDQYLPSTQAPRWAKTEVKLTAQQRDALGILSKALCAETYSPFLLHGVTGSGKTEVYIEAIREVLTLGKSALVIVPEIALTPQLIDRFRVRLGDNLAILHSALNRRARWDSWRALLEGRAHVAIGARSGIFAPLHKLGLIIVDEEHESSYKQAEGLRYHARDLALVRGKLENCPVVLGSATPSLESYAHAKAGHYTLLNLPTRPGSTQQPSVEIVDLNKIAPWDMPTRSISPQLQKSLLEVIARGEQAFLLYNRRGFASYLQCKNCNTVIECPNCSVTLTYHRTRNELLCHYCNLTMVPPQFCSACTPTEDKGPGVLEQRGAGTEKIFEELAELLPGVAIGRLDRDSALDEQTYRGILDQVRDGTLQVLVGTQMIAKGHDLPGVTLVGVVDCDIGLHIPDFRASERAFQLLTQAAGRAGRGDKPGRVILQTRIPQHPSIRHTAQNDYNAFAAFELERRVKTNYPPQSRLLRILASSADKTLARDTLARLRMQLDTFAREEKLPITILGPTAAPIAKIKTHWRAHMLIKAAAAPQLLRVMHVLNQERYKSKKVRLVLDMDPQDLM
ncbi:MAG: primosomal protein N' [Oligoflexia bacterium]|nr:primosomal protein N' [Oligoflexia bacterium]